MTNFLLHRHRKADVQFKQPDGLKELLSDISREVLREQPQCVNTFVADYLEAMLVTRENALIAERTRNDIFDISMTVSDLMRTVGIDARMAERIANTIDKNIRMTEAAAASSKDSRATTPLFDVRNLLEQLATMGGFAAEDLQKIDRIVRVCFKDFYFRQKGFRFKVSRLPDDNWANRVEHTLDLYRQSGPPRWQLERAAVAIQSAYRGYYSRRQQRELAVLNKHATTIQANYRGHLTRQRIIEEDVAIEVQVPITRIETRMSQNFDTAMFKEFDTLRAPELDVQLAHDTAKADAAAKVIQNGYRSYVKRRQGKLPESDDLQGNTIADEPVDDEQQIITEPDYEKTVPKVNEMSADAAAKIIQAGYRGYKERREAREKHVEEAAEEALEEAVGEDFEDEQEIHNDELYVDEQQNEEFETIVTEEHSTLD